MRLERKRTDAVTDLGSTTVEQLLCVECPVIPQRRHTIQTFKELKSGQASRPKPDSCS